jgi:hypothetical protein
MNREVTLRLPEEVFDEAVSVAGLSGFAIDEFISKLLQVIVKPSQTIHQTRAFIQRLFALFSDDEILALVNLKMDAERLDLFNQLLTAQKEKELSAGDATDLEILGSLYDRINLVKSYAMVEAVRRKLTAVD